MSGLHWRPESESESCLVNIMGAPCFVEVDHCVAWTYPTLNTTSPTISPDTPDHGTASKWPSANSSNHEGLELSLATPRMICEISKGALSFQAARMRKCIRYISHSRLRRWISEFQRNGIPYGLYIFPWNHFNVPFRCVHVSELSVLFVAMQPL